MGEAPVLGLLQREPRACSAGFRHGLTWGNVWVETLGQVRPRAGGAAADPAPPWSVCLGATGGGGPACPRRCADRELQSAPAFPTPRLASQAPVTQAREGGWPGGKPVSL